MGNKNKKREVDQMGISSKKARKELKKCLESLLGEAREKNGTLEVLRSFINWMRWNTLCSTNLTWLVVSLITSSLLMYLSTSDFTEWHLYALVLVLFHQLFLTTTLVVYYFFVHRATSVRLQECLRALMACGDDWEYPCLVCEPSEALTLVFVVRDGTLVKIPPNLLVSRDVVLLNHAQYESLCLTHDQVCI